MTYLSFIIRTSDHIKQRVTCAGEIHPLLQWNYILYCILHDLLSSLLWYWNININQQNYCTCILQSMLSEYCLMLYMWTFISYIKTRICLPMAFCGIRVAQFVAFCIVFCGIMSFSIGNFIFYPLIYCFWLPLWHLKIVRIVDKMMMISMLY